MVVKKTLENGLVVLVLSQWNIPKVSMQLWYKVGSKDELSGQKGIAHLIEHMIFRGTKMLSGSDINLIVHKLSGSCNAFTSHDYTGYLFDLPVQHWHYALTIMADCMKNCTFKQSLLNAELKAVIQELKMYNDDYASILLERMMGSIFYDHPYHYPVIGYKKDLWSLKRESLVEFYQHHYIPNNATLVVVGAVKPDEVFEYANNTFGCIPPSLDYKSRDYYHARDIASQFVTIYRDVQQQTVLLVWTVPGACEKKDYILDILSWILGGGKGSRLTALLVDKYALVTELESFVYDLFEYGLFVVKFQPKDSEDTEKIIDIISEETLSIIRDGISPRELQRAIKKTEMDFISLVEDNQKYAYLMGKYYLATGDANYLENYTKLPAEGLEGFVVDIIKNYLRPFVMHKGMVMPLADGERKHWLEFQARSDEEDSRVLNCSGEASLELGSYVHSVAVVPEKLFYFPKPQNFLLKNGLKVLFFDNSSIEKIDVVVDFKARHYYDVPDKQGRMLFMMDLLQEGTSSYSSEELAQEIELHGMSVSTFPGVVSLSLLSGDLVYGLSLLHEMIVKPAFRQEDIDKVRAQILSDITDFWDTPVQFASQLARDVVYKNHPYQRNILGSRDSIVALNRSDIVEAYRDYITPRDTILVIVGNLKKYDIPELVAHVFGSWCGPAVSDLEYPELKLTPSREIAYPMNRDQIVLAFAGLSVRRLDPDYDKLLLYDQILTGGILGSMHSKLFELREKSGLFYTIGGSVVMGANEQPGMAFIKTIVSRDRVEEAQKSIAEVLDQGADLVSEVDLEEAKQAVINSLADNFASNRQMAQVFIFLDRFKLPLDFLDTRASHLGNIRLDEVKMAVRSNIASKHMVKIKIGRL